jgi:esterase/lipase
MHREAIRIASIPSLIWGKPSEKVYLYVHGKMSSKEEAQGFAELACERGFQTLSFDLPEHGERKGEPTVCSIQNGAQELRLILDYAKKHWDSRSLFACSLGACFSLVAFQSERFDRCLFLSPILDMEHLIQNMMSWFNVDEKQLAEKQEIPTPMGEKLSWAYYQYVKEHPIKKWQSRTCILYGEKDNLTERSVVDAFCARFDCELETLAAGEHYFHTAEQLAFLRSWLDRKL